MWQTNVTGTPARARMSVLEASLKGRRGSYLSGTTKPSRQKSCDPITRSLVVEKSISTNSNRQGGGPRDRREHSPVTYLLGGDKRIGIGTEQEKVEKNYRIRLIQTIRKISHRRSGPEQRRKTTRRSAIDSLETRVKIDGRRDRGTGRAEPSLPG